MILKTWKKRLLKTFTAAKKRLPREQGYPDIPVNQVGWYIARRIRKSDVEW